MNKCKILENARNGEYDLFPEVPAQLCSGDCCNCPHSLKGEAGRQRGRPTTPVPDPPFIRVFSSPRIWRILMLLLENPDGLLISHIAIKTHGNHKSVADQILLLEKAKLVSVQKMGRIKVVRLRDGMARQVIHAFIKFFIDYIHFGDEK